MAISRLKTKGNSLVILLLSALSQWRNDAVSTVAPSGYWEYCIQRQSYF